MTLQIHPNHPDISNDMWDKSNGIIKAGRHIPGSLISVLRECQDLVGYLPVELIDHISRGLHLSSSTVYGVATFYSFFSLVPKGRNIIKVCMGTACYVKGIKDVMDRIENEYTLDEGGTTEDRRFSLEPVRCLGACGLAPVIVINEDIHGLVESKHILDLLEKYK